MWYDNFMKKKLSDNYRQKSERIRAWGELFTSVGSLFSRVVWGIVLLIVLATVGRLFLDEKSSKSERITLSSEKKVVKPIDWRGVDRSVVALLKSAEKEAKSEAKRELDRWIAELMARVDSDFLPWYFGYWNQQKIGLRALMQGVIHWVDSDRPTPQEKITQTIQEAFAKRVLRPVIAQKRIEKITRHAIERYLERLRKGLEKIPESYHIPQPLWESYLEEIALLSADVEGGREIELSLKALAGAGAATTMIVVKSLSPAIKGVGSKISAKLASKAAAKMAAKTGGKVAAKAGGELLGPIVGIGIVIWDLYDHAHTKKVNKPILRENIEAYLKEMEETLLEDPEASVMATIRRMETSILQGLKKDVKAKRRVVL